MATISSGDGSLVLGDKSISSGSKSGDTGEGLLADGANGSLSSLIDVLSNQFTTRGSDGSDLVGSGVPSGGSSVGDSRGH